MADIRLGMRRGGSGSFALKRAALATSTNVVASSASIQKSTYCAHRHPCPLSGSVELSSGALLRWRAVVGGELWEVPLFDPFDIADEIGSFHRANAL